MSEHTDEIAPHPECVRVALRNGTVDPRERTLELREALVLAHRALVDTPMQAFYTEQARIRRARAIDAVKAALSGSREASDGH